ncbi:MAG: TIGR03087 family PEP-CTERM/XrtA system glycosyltransferase [Rhodopila sp.]|nr:TIGR03087 family PEP-CTERM/XrtA system glycosyltransferase [Rhodopila sp.]
MDILYVSHCIPWPPDKGDRIRAYHSVRTLADHHRVHLACLARTAQEAAAVSPLRDRCASVAIEVMDKGPAMLRGLWSLARGGSFTTAFHAVPALRAHVQWIVREQPIRAVVLLSSSMATFAPAGLPFIADWGDVDSEKRFQYARMRLGGFAHGLEGQRLRRVERDYALRSRRTFLTTPNELRLFRGIAPQAPLGCAGNGIDTDTFDPAAGFDVPADLRRRKFLVFVGMLSYFPNSDGIVWFADAVFPELRRNHPDLELLVVGRNPGAAVEKLAARDGVVVVGEVKDVRPYLAAARGVIAPLRIARGIQNKVLEALAMGKTVLASGETCQTFQPDLPAGVVCCRSVQDYVEAVRNLPDTEAANMSIVVATRAKFGWADNLAPLVAELSGIEQEAMASAPPGGTRANPAGS